MDLKEFQYLIALEEEGSISRAADRLYMAQSSLSQFLQQYESELGTKLFVRTSKGIRPTYGGHCFIERLRQITLDYQRAKNELWDNANMESGRVIFGISTFRGGRMLPRILSAFYARHPKVSIEVVEANSRQLEDLLMEGKLDLAVIALPSNKPKIDVEFLKNDEVLIVANKDHPIMNDVSLIEGTDRYWATVEDIARYELILSDHTTILGTISRDLMNERGLEYHAVNEHITAQMGVYMAREGLGLAFAYQSTTAPYENVRYLRIGREGVFIELGLAYPSNEYHSRAAEELEATIRELFSKEEW